MKNRHTAKAVLADLLLREKGHGSLDEFVRVRRLRMQPMSWEQIASELVEVTDGRVVVSGSTIRLWFLSDDTEQTSTSSGELPESPGLFDPAGSVRTGLVAS